MYRNVHSHFIHQRQNLETIQISVHRNQYKSLWVYAYDRILLSNMTNKPLLYTATQTNFIGIVSSKRMQTHKKYILYNSIHMKIKNRDIQSMVIEV